MAVYVYIVYLVVVLWVLELFLGGWARSNIRFRVDYLCSLFVPVQR